MTNEPNIAELDALVAWAESEHAKSVAGNPSEWDQGTWATARPEVSCGTACCIAGKAVARAGGVFLIEPDTSTAYLAEMPGDRKVEIDVEASRLLGLTYEQGSALFWSGNDINSVRRIVDAIKEGDLEPAYGGEDDY